MPDPGAGAAAAGAASQRRWLEYLPAIFQQEPEGAAAPGQKPGGLGGFLAPFERQFALFEQILAEMDRNFAVSFATDDFVPWLAQWVAHSFDEEWDDDKRRRFLAQAMDLYRWRGTVAGLKRYIELWLDLGPDDVEILEGRWPGGMQIGVASRIGRFEDAAGSNPVAEAGGPAFGGPAIGADEARESDQGYATNEDYYVVQTVGPDGAGARRSGARIYYDARFVHRIVLEADGVRIAYLAKDPDGKRALREVFHRAPPELPAGAANVRRLSGLVDYRGLVARPPGSARSVVGGTLLAGEAPRPYSFIVEIRTRPDQPFSPAREQRLRNLLETEKPAHTQYYLRFKPAAGRARRGRMQIGVRSSVGLDTTV
jgi:phage tail-like protein